MVVRRRLEVVDGRQLYGDVLGDLISWDGGELVIRTRDGSLVRVNWVDVVAGKPVPPPPAARAPQRGETLARVAASGWPAVEISHLGDWWLQASDGFTGRANSVQPSGSPGLPLDAALERVRSFYAERGLPAWIQVVVDSPLESSLLDRGWELQTSGKEAWATTEVWVCRVAELIERLEALGVPPESAMTPPVELGDLDEEWERLYGRSLSSAAAHHVLTGGDGAVPVALARLRAGAGPSASDLIAIGRGVVTGVWLGLAAIEVAPAHRRRGLAQRVMAELTRWGASAGARWAYLQFGEENAPARALYEKLGFRPDHRYRYYAAPPA
ncbi:GNAT family N-acetyltransferase [Flindersiella endophytica]